MDINLKKKKKRYNVHNYKTGNQLRFIIIL